MNTEHSNLFLIQSQGYKVGDTISSSELYRVKSGLVINTILKMYRENKGTSSSNVPSSSSIIDIATVINPFCARILECCMKGRDYTFESEDEIQAIEEAEIISTGTNTCLEEFLGWRISEYIKNLRKQ